MSALLHSSLQSHSWYTPHLDPQLIQYNLNDYLDGPKAEIAAKCGCHNGPPILTEDRDLPSGGFAFRTEPVDAADLAPLTGLINLYEPEQSALIRLYIGEYDHPNYAGDEEGLTTLKETVIPWIESLQP